MRTGFAIRVEWVKLPCDPQRAASGRLHHALHLERAELLSETRADLGSEILTGLAGDDRRERARAAYLAICLELDETCSQEAPEQWRTAMEALRGFGQISQVLFHHSPVPAAGPLQQKAIRAGLERPTQRRELW